MKTKIKLCITVLIGILFLISCDKKEENDPPQIPPIETMVLDFGELSNTDKSVNLYRYEESAMSNVNWVYSATTVGVWNLILGVTFAIPIAAFQASFTQTPIYLGDKTWQWFYTLDGFSNQYSARLTGKINSNHIKWEMYISKSGTNPYNDFLWFEGTMELDGKSGDWILYHSNEFPEEVVQVEWKIEGEEVGNIQYNYVRELDNDRQSESFYNSYLIYGLQDETLDAFVKIHASNNQKGIFTDTNIEWSRTDFSGHVKAEHFYDNTDWHCWNSDGLDVICN